MDSKSEVYSCTLLYFSALFLYRDYATIDTFANNEKGLKSESVSAPGQKLT